MRPSTTVRATYPAGTVEVPVKPGPGYEWDEASGTWIALSRPAPTADDLKAHLAALRFDVETGGLTVGTMEIATDRDSQGKILAARVKAADDPDFTTTWKALNGWFVLDATAIVALSDAVLAHVAACFSAEESTAQAVDAGTVTTQVEIDAAFAGALETASNA
ncbi:DUF4376 domain-containing protein [Breoghania sp. JC706]|uniref:DUF4376 domain-containing protein n=1 Tax=Breoghania sp. JC706 TaxID=3117732 RepID=UPI0030081D25